MFVENLLGDISKLRKPIIQDSVHWGFGEKLLTGTEVKFIPNVEHGAKYNELKNHKQTIYWSIENKESGQYAGIISVLAVTQIKSEIHISLSNPNYRGKEISIEAISLVLNYLKYKKKIEVVEISIKNTNRIMQKVLKSCNFTLCKKSNSNTTYSTII
jgi:hypothetical protein